jgi:hypothetical protein
MHVNVVDKFHRFGLPTGLAPTRRSLNSKSAVFFQAMVVLIYGFVEVHVHDLCVWVQKVKQVIVILTPTHGIPSSGNTRLQALNSAIG